MSELDAATLREMLLLDFKYLLKLYAYYDVIRFKAAADRTTGMEESREAIIHNDAAVLGDLLV